MIDRCNEAINKSNLWVEDTFQITPKYLMNVLSYVIIRQFLVATGMI
jgi:hypothetical protein